jgi:hypothetical protein
VGNKEAGKPGLGDAAAELTNSNGVVHRKSITGSERERVS